MHAIAKWDRFLLFTILICLAQFLLAALAYADDCMRYLENPENLLTVPRGVIEDCMRTPGAQAILTALAGSVAGGLIASAVGAALGAAAGGILQGAGGAAGASAPPDAKPSGSGDLKSLLERFNQVNREIQDPLLAQQAEAIREKLRSTGTIDEQALAALEAAQAGWRDARLGQIDAQQAQAGQQRREQRQQQMIRDGYVYNPATDAWVPGPNYRPPAEPTSASRNEFNNRMQWIEDNKHRLTPEQQAAAERILAGTRQGGEATQEDVDRVRRLTNAVNNILTGQSESQGAAAETEALDAQHAVDVAHAIAQTGRMAAGVVEQHVLPGSHGAISGFIFGAIEGRDQGLGGAVKNGLITSAAAYAGGRIGSARPESVGWNVMAGGLSSAAETGAKGGGIGDMAQSAAIGGAFGGAVAYLGRPQVQEQLDAVGQRIKTAFGLGGQRTGSAAGQAATSGSRAASRVTGVEEPAPAAGGGKGQEAGSTGRVTGVEEPATPGTAQPRQEPAATTGRSGGGEGPESSGSGRPTGGSAPPATSPATPPAPPETQGTGSVVRTGTSTERGTTQTRQSQSPAADDLQRRGLGEDQYEGQAIRADGRRLGAPEEDGRYNLTLDAGTEIFSGYPVRPETPEMTALRNQSMGAESHDCAVSAIAAATGKSYQECETAIAGGNLRLGDGTGPIPAGKMGEAIDAIVPNRLTSPASHLTREGLVSRIRKGDRMVADVQDSLGSNRHAVAAIGLDESSGQNFVVFDPEPNNFRDVPVDDFLARVRLRTSHLVSSNDPI